MKKNIWFPRAHVHHNLRQEKAELGAMGPKSRRDRHKPRNVFFGKTNQAPSTSHQDPVHCSFTHPACEWARASPRTGRTGEGRWAQGTLSPLRTRRTRGFYCFPTEAAESYFRTRILLWTEISSLHIQTGKQKIPSSTLMSTLHPLPCPGEHREMRTPWCLFLMNPRGTVSRKVFVEEGYDTEPMSRNDRRHWGPGVSCRQRTSSDKSNPLPLARTSSHHIQRDYADKLLLTCLVFEQTNNATSGFPETLLLSPMANLGVKWNLSVGLVGQFAFNGL